MDTIRIPRYELTVNETDNVIRQNFAVLYPGIIDPERVSEIRPEEFEAVSQFASDAQTQLTNSKKGFCQKLKEYVQKHPTAHKAIKYGSLAAAMLLLVSLPVSNTVLAANSGLPSVENLQNNGYSINNEIVNLVEAGRNITSGGALNQTGLAEFNAAVSFAYGNISTFHKSIAEESRLNSAIEELVNHSGDARRIVDEQRNLNDSYAVFIRIDNTLNEMNSLFEPIGNYSIINLKETEFSKNIESLINEIRKFDEVYAMTVNNFNPELGRIFCDNLLRNLEPAAEGMPISRENLANKTMGLKTGLSMMEAELKLNSNVSAEQVLATIENLDNNLKTSGNPYIETLGTQETVIIPEEQSKGRWYQSFTRLPLGLIWWTPLILADLKILSKYAEEWKDDSDWNKKMKRHKKINKLAGTDWDDECL